ncbi:MAG: 6-phosphogluconolactonase [Deltaproteobacteria bacterium]
MMRRVEVLLNSSELAKRGADLFAAEAAAAIASRGEFSVALSGGATPLPLYTLLATDEYLCRIDWSRIHFFWADERCVPHNHQGSNFYAIFAPLLSRLQVDAAHFHRIPGELPPDQAAFSIEKKLRSFFAGHSLPCFDLVLLGMGVDGHTASIFPGSHSCLDASRIAVEVYLDKPHSNRVTLTMSVLNNSRNVVFIVSGKEKAETVRAVLEDDTPRYPASMVQLAKGTVTWLLDLDAASLLTGYNLPKGDNWRFNG